MPQATNSWLNKIAKEKTKLLQDIFEMEPRHVDVKDPRTKKVLPRQQGEDIIYTWDKLYACDPIMKGIVVETVTGPSTPDRDYVDDINANPAMPYQQIRALIGDGGKWKWPEIYKNLDLLQRRGPAWRHIDDPSNLGKIENPNPHIVPLKCLVVGGGPVGCRLAIELALGGHRVTMWEKRREIIDKDSGLFESVGFTNRVNRPHINNFCRNDLDQLNGRNFMTAKMCYPVFTNTETSSIGIDESQMLLLKTALLIGVNFELGVGYEDASIDVENEQNQRPSWMVDYTADKIAQERYGKQASGSQRFDALFGCDGGQSKVRRTQVDWLGEPKTRLYKKMFGIVSNIQKCNRKKLIELGFRDGLEPADRTGAKTGIFFYKASYHNYFIVHPSAEEMEANGIPWKGVFGFHKARGEVNKEKMQLKEVYKKYMTKKCKELNIPIDDTLSNEGFVAAPNDVMGFDFSEFYNCEKSAACSIPPLEWDLDNDGEWEVACPLVALAGDAVADPNWLLGVGLQRGWNCALDATFYADNLYNNKSFNGRPPQISEPIDGPVDWDQHMDNLMNLMEKLGHNARESKLAPEMETGMLDEKGPVVSQIRRKMKQRNIEAPVPQYLPPVAPWGRYREFKLAVDSNYKGKDLFSNIHPLATREIAILEHNDRWVDQKDRLKRTVTRPTAAMLTWPKRFECSAFWGMMKLLEIDGKSASKGYTPTGKSSGGAAPAASSGSRSPTPRDPSPPPPPPPPPPPEPVRPKPNIHEVREKAMRKSLSLRDTALKAAMAGPPAGTVQGRVKGHAGGLASLFQQNKPKKWPPEPDDDDQPPPPPPPVPGPRYGAAAAAKPQRPSVISAEDLNAINNLSEHLSKAQPGGGGGGGAMSQIQMQHEKAIMKAKLEYAVLEVEAVQAQQRALQAKLNFAETEVELIKKALKAYENA